MPADGSIEIAREQRATFACEVRAEPGDDRLVRLSFSSEEPVARSYGLEILGHGPGEADLSRIVSGRAPLLLDHRADLDHQVGTIVSAEIVGNRGQAIVRFGKGARAAEFLARVRDGEIGSVSVGYRVEAMRSDGERDGQPVYRVTKWTPLEISLVSIPADDSVGIGRKAGSAGTLIAERTAPMPKDTPTTPAAPGNDATRAERVRVTEITSMGQHFNLPAEAITRAIEDGVSVDEFRGMTLEHLGRSQAPDTRAGATRIALGLDHFGGAADQRRVLDYSIARTIFGELTGDWSGAGLEREVGQEIRSQIGRAADGVYVPSWALADRMTMIGHLDQRDLLTSANTGSLIGTEHLHGAFIESLRPEVPVIGLGARVIPGLIQDVVIPRQTAESTAEWIAEDASATESTPTFDGVSLSMKQLSATTRITRKMRKQSLPALDGLLRDDLRKAIAIGLNQAAITGAGTATEPLGILNTPGVTVLDVSADGQTINWALVTKLISAVDEADASMGSLGWLTNNKVKGNMMSAPRDAGSGVFILDESHGGKMAGYPIAFSSLVPSNLTKGAGTNLSALIFGNWSDMLIGQWGGMDLIVDDVTESPKGNVRITIHSEWDIALRHPESFAVLNEIIA